MLKYSDMPKGVISINLIQIFSTVGYAVLMGLLNFYLTTHGMSKFQANTLTASFFALNFLLHFLGGALGGRYFSFRGLFTISLTMQIIGMCFIAVPTQALILLGMAIFITGSGLNVSCINMMLTQLFKADDRRRRIAFSINYSFMNIGFVMSFFVAGYLQGHNAYSSAFYFAALCLGIAFVIHLLAWKYVNDKATYFVEVYRHSKKRFVTAPLIIVACMLASLYLMYHPNFASMLIYVVFAGAMAYMIRLAMKQGKEYRIKIFVYMVLSSASMIFACVQGLQSTALETFVEFNTTKSLFGWHLQPATVNMFESLGVIIFGIILAIRMRQRQEANKPYTPTYLVSKGLGLYVIAFLVIPFGIYINGRTEMISVIYPILLLVIVAAGEVHVNATNYSLVGELIDPTHQGLFTGYLFMNIAVGVNLAGPIANFAVVDSHHVDAMSASATNPLYMQIFLAMTFVAAIIAFIFFCVTRQLNQMMAKPMR